MTRVRKSSGLPMLLARHATDGMVRGAVGDCCLYLATRNQKKTVILFTFFLHGRLWIMEEGSLGECWIKVALERVTYDWCSPPLA